jgi:isopenicillin N synthase-like dioxygenase
MIKLDPIDYQLWSIDKFSFSELLGKSFKETGFAIIENHRISEKIIRNADMSSEAFFSLPQNIKQKYSDPEDGFQRGYSPVGTENAKNKKEADLKEFWHTGRKLLPSSKYNATMKQTPCVDEIKDFDQNISKLYELGNELLKAIALYLDLNEGWFQDKVNYGNSILRLLHYPPQVAPPLNGSVRAGAHEDINLITLLLGASESGLQVKHRSGNWIDINAKQGAVVVNVGDMLQRITSGVLPSTTHRVINPKPSRAMFPRYSKPFFLHLNNDTIIEPLKSCLKEGGIAEPAITAQEFLTQRLVEIGLKNR